MVVGNPPHFSVWPKMYDLHKSKIEVLKTVDKMWHLHKKFYNAVNEILNPNSNIVLVENKKGSNPSIFRSMLDKNLVYVGTIEPSMQQIIGAIRINLLNSRTPLYRVVAQYNRLFNLAIKTLILTKSIKNWIAEFENFYFFWCKNIK